MGLGVDNPFVVFAVALAAQWSAAYLGSLARNRRRRLSSDDQHDFDTVQVASLTLLALLIGFSFSMAVTRYDQRKTLEEAEANAIGTEYVRADLLPAGDAERVRQLLRQYLDQRIAFYEARDASDIDRINADTAKLQNELWAVVQHAAGGQPTPVLALTVAGMNDVLNSQGYTQAAWWNRIPAAAWTLMGLIAVFCNLLVGYGERRKGATLLVVLPVIVSVAFLLVADIDSPRGGVIRVLPQNLLAAARSIAAH